MMVKPITRVCIDCNSRLKNRSKQTLRCWGCRVKYLKINANGRTTPKCVACERKLSIKNNTTGLCSKCVDRTKYKRTERKSPAWNKGISIFKDKEQKKEHVNKNRREKRKLLPNDKRIADRIRTLIRVQMKRKCATKKSKTTEIIGCSIPEYIKHIEAQFEAWMSWDNYGNGLDQWNIDHIIPVSNFDLTNEIELKKAFNYKNCRPLRASENFKKKNSLAITATVTFGYSH